MNSVDLTYGPADQVAGRLDNSPGVKHEELHSALVNALNRIANLEAIVTTLATRPAPAPRPWAHLVNSCPARGREHRADFEGFRAWLATATADDDGPGDDPEPFASSLDSGQLRALYLFLSHAFDRREFP